MASTEQAGEPCKVQSEDNHWLGNDSVGDSGEAGDRGLVLDGN